MLALTESAERAVEAIVSQPDAPDGAVLRLSATESHDNGTAPSRELQLAVVDAPEHGDAILDGVAISVEPATVDFLEDKVLDAELSEDNVRFSLYLQPAEPADPADDRLNDA